MSDQSIDSLFFLPKVSAKTISFCKQERLLVAWLESAKDIRAMEMLLDLPDCSYNATPLTGPFPCTSFDVSCNMHPDELQGDYGYHINTILKEYKDISFTVYAFCKTHWEIFEPVLIQWQASLI